MYQVFAFIIAVLLSPIIIPIAIYAGLNYHWTDTVPKEEEEDAKTKTA